MIEKRPWIAAALPALAILALWLAPSAAILYVRLVPNTWWALKIAIPLLSAVGLVILVIVLFRAVRLASDGIPAAPNGE